MKKPFNDKWCGKCSLILTARFGTLFYCRLYSESFGTESGSLDQDENGNVLRHKLCVKGEKNG
jgi:hypothetical protein